MALKGKRKATETQLVKECIKFLALHRIYAWRSNSGAVKGSYTDKAGKTRERFVRFNTAKGMSDITGIIPKMRARIELDNGFIPEITKRGIFLAVECKTDKGKLRPEQKAYLLKISQAGGIALVVRSVEELEADLRAERVIQ